MARFDGRIIPHAASPAIDITPIALSFKPRKPTRTSDPHPGTEQDRLIALRLVRTIDASNRRNSTELRFLVYHGSVILQGHIDRPEWRNDLVRSVSGLPAVRRVIDRMTPADQPVFEPTDQRTEQPTVQLTIQPTAQPTDEPVSLSAA